MSLLALFIIGTITFFSVLYIMLTAFAKSDENIIKWTPLIVLLFVTILASWIVTDLSAQWVLIEATTLFGAILISLSKTERSIDVGWKFLLINSFGLGIAFMGIIFVASGTKDDSPTSLDFLSLLPKISTHETLLVETGIWLAVFGYTAKLGLFPNHFWVSDTYAESPSQISSLLSSFLPVSVILAIYPFLQLETEFKSSHFSTVLALLILGIITMIYSLLTIYHTDDIRRITALTALFHSGGLAVFLCFSPTLEMIYYVLCANITVKSLMFSTMGILRMDLGVRNLSSVDPNRGLNKFSIYIHLFALGMAFVVPFSPFFISDLIIIKLGMQQLKYWVIIIPIINLVFFLVLLNKFLPLLELQQREFLADNSLILIKRLKITFVMVFLAVSVGGYGIYYFINGGFANV
jgi:hydrogenase-4 component F